MATKKKMLLSSAGTAAAGGGGGLDIDDVFSTYLYKGNGSTQTITNDIDLDGEGGLVWMKSRTGTDEHTLMDTERGIGSYLVSHSTLGNQGTSNVYVTSYNSNGFSLGAGNQINRSATDFASWTFRKAPKFFDVVTYTGDGTSGRTVAHDLGTTVGTLIVKCTSETKSWFVWHRGLSNGGNGWIALNDSAAEGSSSSLWDSTIPSDSVFTLGSSINTNGNGKEYVAYLFAHNDGDGDFGPDGDQDIIKCGSYTGNGTVGQEINLGFEPQFVMAKITNTTGTWYIQDAMRGMTGNGSPHLRPNSSDAELNSNGYIEGNIELTPTGFKLDTDDQGGGNGNGDTYIYMAIRRGPLAVPEDATEVFAIDTLGGTSPNPPDFYSGWPVDMSMFRRRSQTADWATVDRLRGPTSELKTNSSETEQASQNRRYDQMTGYFDDSNVVSDIVSWMWKRAPGYFDAVAYTGNGTAGRTVSHNLGVAPEMMWVKNRHSTQSWLVWHKAIANTEYFLLNAPNAKATGTWAWNSTSPTETSFSVGNDPINNDSLYGYIAYLFASCPGVSKVGSFTTISGALNVDCGFSNGARFVLLKKTNNAEDWAVFDVERGIVSGGDPFLALNTNAAEANFGDAIDPLSSGFIVNGAFWGSGNTYIFYAIA